MRTPSTTAITAASLRHKPLVIVTWLILALAGAFTATTAIQNMTYSYATPGQPGSRNSWPTAAEAAAGRAFSSRRSSVRP
jgi:hypothetical protein